MATTVHHPQERFQKLSKRCIMKRLVMIPTLSHWSKNVPQALITVNCTRQAIANAKIALLESTAQVVNSLTLVFATRATYALSANRSQTQASQPTRATQRALARPWIKMMLHMLLPAQECAPKGTTALRARASPFHALLAHIKMK